ncbi:WD40 repeat-like protein [Decorospora gaudefroyi]|uniref:WD40 repeat-like protein n=1 Tax=Decorospora gaudefroyi TaxID=184978 RepID=A0A6A5K1P9_9PLEO|nr:WD40 repeat-like protein [Decorospora gaudefroyi]
MHTQHVLDRAYGFVPNHVLKRACASRLIYALQSSAVNFSQHQPSQDDPHARIPAHVSGVNALTVDKFEGRYLLSGGADSSIAIWDLEAQTTVTEAGQIHLPLTAVNKTSEEHKLGITQIQFYPFDSLAFLTSSYDHTLKLYSSETLAPSASFDLDSVVYHMALSPIASHLLVACATQHPNVRLVDLRSGANTHSLAGHAGAVLSTAWSPVHEHMLVSGATDGSVRFWDVRRSVGELGVLDLEDSVGVLGTSTSFSHNAIRGQAHRGPVNGLVWTEDGRHLVTCGHDQRIRVWNTDTGANTLANFGPMVKNSVLAPCIPVLPPVQNLQPGADVMFYPNEREILAYELFDGKLIRRLRRSQSHAPIQPGTAKGLHNAKDRITSLAWRPHDVEMYSAQADGSIVAWKPRTEEDAELDEEEEQEREEREEGKKRKRGVLDEIYQGLTKKQVTFGNMGP